MTSKTIDSNHRKFWNQQQKALRQNLTHADNHQKAMELFLSQHAMVHSAEMSNAGLWSFEDETLDGVTGQQKRLIPIKCEHSIVWIIWHLTRIEDITMNLLVAGSPQIMLKEGWLERMKINARDTGNGTTADGVADLSASIDIGALRDYRLAVGRQTRSIVKLLKPEQIKQKVNPARLQQIVLEGAVTTAGKEVLEYWAGLTTAGLLLMPPTRHNFIHWNEALRIKQKFIK
jgi:hypothetical protein